MILHFFFFQAEDGIRDSSVTGVQTCALPIYRLEVALRTFALVVASEPQARLLVTGRLVSFPEVLLDELGLRDSVDFVGRYSQREAPDLIRRAHLMLHTKVKDPCPSAVIEAMACGLPIVYPK